MNKTAGIIIVGNEILSGRTRDWNAYWIAQQFHRIGVSLRKISVIPDVMDTIISEIRLLRDMFDYVIVCGGIGPTPDDLTRQAVSRAFGVPCVPHPEAVQLLKDFYIERCTSRRLTMAELPENALLIHNPLTMSPGFQVDNVFVLPGIPELVEAMLPVIIEQIDHGTMFEKEFSSRLGESDFADLMEDAIHRFPDVDFGSYPSMKDNTWRCTLVVKGYSEKAAEEAAAWLQSAVIRREEEFSHG
jgi:molybdenum cofactor synthesis domain-containing protein